MPKGKLSKRQAAIYEYICSYTDQHGYPPSVREIGAAVNLASPSTVHMHLKVLEQFGLIDRDPKKPRTMKIVPQASNISDTAKLATSIVGDSSSFILRVRGESMINAGIFDGDYIVVKEQQDAHDGEIVVALIDDSATVKTFYRENDRIRLQPENDFMEPIYVQNPVILGRVTALIRSIS